MSDQTTLPPPAPCPECGGGRGHAFTGMAMWVAPSPWTFTAPSSHLRALVCTTCGHTTLYATDPHKLRRNR